MDKVISVIIVDDHPLVLNGFEFILKNSADIVLLGTFTSSADALAFLQTQPVDIALVDINMPGMNGIDTTSIIKKDYPNTHVIAISNLNEGSIALRMLQAGALGYLLKNVSAKDLIQGIHSVPKITEREREVLKWMAQGYTTPKIAELMFISPLTVESHRRNLLQKFFVSNSASLIHKATEMKFI